MKERATKEFGISNDIGDESIEAKARWFRPISVQERTDLLDSWTELVLQNNARLIGVKDTLPAKGRVRVR
jgi:hypothetical protein